jgi:hypothetical protein
MINVSKSVKTRPNDYLKVNGSFLQLPHKTILSTEFNSLKYSTRCLYLLLLTRWDRKKDKADKERAFSYRDMQLISKMDRRVIANAIKELEDKKFIYVTRCFNSSASKYSFNTSWRE